MEEKLQFKISEATKEDRDLIHLEKESFNMPYPRKFHLLSIETTFVAKSQGKIVGFISILPEGNGVYEISGLYNRLGFDRKGIGSKLIGQANAHLLSVKAKMVHLSAATGRYIKNGEIVKDSAGLFYKKTNYERDVGRIGEQFIWFPKANSRVRKKTVKPKMGLAPQNLMNPQRRLNKHKMK